jgi:hypothetical protein
VAAVEHRPRKDTKPVAARVGVQHRDAELGPEKPP